jgi:hypothetical protein
VLAVKVDSDKRSRAEAVTPLFEAGKVFFPESTPWLIHYTDELATFPSAVHDDCVDSTTMALNYLRSPAKPNLVQFWEKMAIKDNCKAGRHERNDSDPKRCKYCCATMVPRA